MANAKRKPKVEEDDYEKDEHGKWRTAKGASPLQDVKLRGAMDAVMWKFGRADGKKRLVESYVAEQKAKDRLKALKDLAVKKLKGK